MTPCLVDYTKEVILRSLMQSNRDGRLCDMKESIEVHGLTDVLFIYVHIQPGNESSVCTPEFSQQKFMRIPVRNEVRGYD
jgi:hypothetical protein